VLGVRVAERGFFAFDKERSRPILIALTGEDRATQEEGIESEVIGEEVNSFD